jgi:hypothetical protein
MPSRLTNPYESPNVIAAADRGSAPSSTFSPRAITLATMILAAAATRIIPHPWNFTAVGAMCLFGGAYFQRRWMAFLVPMVALFLSDIVLAATVYGFRGLNVISMSYLLFALTTLLGMTLRGRVNAFTVPAAAVVASGGFFLVSNFHVWLTGHTYPHTTAGLMACYTAAIPFAQNMLLGNLVYSGVMFGAWELLQRGLPVLRPRMTATVEARA